MLRGLVDDLRLARRSLLSQRGFVFAAVLAIAAGVGANAAAFSAIRAILFRPLPFHNAAELVSLWQIRPDGQSNLVSPRNFLAWETRAKSFSLLAALAAQFYNITGDDSDAEQIIAARVTAGLFPVLAVRPAFGRIFQPGEDRPDAHKVAILSNALWFRRYGGKAEAIGRTILLNGNPYEIVGVLPPEFEFLSREFAIWVPFPLDETTRGDSHVLRVFGRMAPGVSIERAHSEMTVIAKSLEAERPERNRGWGVRTESLHEDTVGKLRGSLYALWGAAGVLMLIAVFNVANLLLARGAARQAEIAVRCALGAGPWRIARQLLTESVLLALLGGGLGIAMAAAAAGLMRAGVAADIPRIGETRIDLGVLAFTLAVTIASAVLFGSIPAWKAASPEFQMLLKEEGRGASPGVRARRWQSWLVSWQIGLAVLLLSGAALSIGSFLRLQSVDRGFDPTKTLAFRISLPVALRPAPKARVEIQRIVDRMAMLPGVIAAAASTGIPLDGRQTLGMQYRLESAPPGNPSDRPVAITQLVTPAYLTALGMHLREGRWITARDREDSPPVIVVSRALASRHWPGESALGKRLIVGSPGGLRASEISREIVGVTGDILYPTGKAGDAIEIYFPLAQTGWHSAYVYLRARADPAVLIAPARHAVAEINPDVPVSGLRTLEEELRLLNGRRRFDGQIAALLAGLALLLTVIGVYGVICCSAAQQTREIAVRVAFGAQPRDILSHILKETLRMSALGVVLGIAAYFPMVHMLRGIFYGIDSAQYWSLAAAALCISVLAVLVSLVPARRTARTDPAVVLHEPPRW